MAWMLKSFFFCLVICRLQYIKIFTKVISVSMLHRWDFRTKRSSGTLTQLLPVVLVKATVWYWHLNILTACVYMCIFKSLGTINLSDCLKCTFKVKLVSLPDFFGATVRLINSSGSVLLKLYVKWRFNGLFSI